MEIIDRKENPLLNRVEIEFRWNHEDRLLFPCRNAQWNCFNRTWRNRDLIVIKNLKTRFE